MAPIDRVVEPKHWLYEWIDEFDVNPDNVSSVFKSAAAVARLTELAGSVMVRDSISVDPSRDSVVVGRTLDLHSEYTCGLFSCMKNRIERTFLSTWHYFDSVVVAGPSEKQLVHNIMTTKKADRERKFINPLRHNIALFLYLRQIGASDHIIFRPKYYPICTSCYESESERRGILAVTDEAARSRVLSTLRAEAQLDMSLRWPRVWGVEISHNSLPESMVFYVESRKKPTRQEALTQFFHRGTHALLEDVEQAEQLQLPLLQEVRASFFGSSTTEAATEDSVALQIELPFLQGVSASDLLKLMQDERPSFDRFQATIRKAVREKVEKAGDKSPVEISRQIEKDLIRPGLAEIDVSLTSARKALAKKSGTAIGVGSALVTVGVLTAIPLVIAAGVSAIASPILDAKKYLDDRATLESKDIYFLWQMQRHAKPIH
ncbi:hypothetical protein ABT008_19735 [Micromonospora sp. NPDC002389]|uniref:hypothetical protein n=1 Tax=Micromonospora sp. NPDC002389 TaxID=3154272 RepID=UPI003332C9F2